MQAMVARVLEQEKAVRQVLNNDCKTAHLIAAWQDIEVLESLNKALASLANQTDIISWKDYVTVSCVRPSYFCTTFTLKLWQCVVMITGLQKILRKQLSHALQKIFQEW